MDSNPAWGICVKALAARFLASIFATVRQGATTKQPQLLGPAAAAALGTKPLACERKPSSAYT